MKAKPAHSSQIFRADIGAGAIYEAARILNGFRETLAGEPHLTFNPGVMLGGTAVDLDPALARGTASGKENVDRRAGDGDGRPAHAVAPNSSSARRSGCWRSSRRRCRTRESTLTFDEGYPPLAPTAGNERLLALYDQASRDVGAGPVTAVNPDARARPTCRSSPAHVKMILDGIGLMGHSDHTPQETADLADTAVADQAGRAAAVPAGERRRSLTRGADGSARTPNHV